MIKVNSEKINLDNNYYLEILKNNTDKNIDNTDFLINNMKLSIIREKRVFLIKIDFALIKKQEYKKNLKKILKLKNKIIKYNNKNIKKKVDIGIEDRNNNTKLLGYIVNYNEQDKNHKEFITGINAIFYSNKEEMYNYIYDNVCAYLDSFFYGKNLCDFKNNKCGEKRNTSSNVGCCRHYKNKLLGPLLKDNFIPCEYLNKDNMCSAKCLGCKLFTCDYLRKKGIRFKIKDIFLLDVFFNFLQKYYIKIKVFTPKEEIIKKLLIL